MCKYIHNNKGSAMVLMIIIFAVGMILGTALLRISLAETNFSARQENKMQAHYIARSGAVSIAEYMMADPGDAKNLIGETSNTTPYADGEFTVIVKEKEGNSNKVSITSTGVYNGVTQEVKIEMDGTSITGVGEFEHALAAKEGIDDEAVHLLPDTNTGVTITGSVGVMEGEEIDPNVESIASGGTDKNMTFFPEIIEPEEGDYTYIGSPSYPMYFSSDGNYKIDDVIFSGTGGGPGATPNINVTNNSDVHLYVYGEMNMGPNARINVEDGSRLFIYVVDGGDVTFKGAGFYENKNILILAPKSSVDWQNAQHGVFNGVIYAKEIQLHLHTTIVYNPEMSTGANAEMPTIGVTYTGYDWVD